MKKLIVYLTLVVIAPPCSWAQDLPPDYYHDAQSQATAFWENPTPGYVVDTEGDLRPEVQYVSDGGAPRTFICRESRLSFQLASVDTTPGIPDTIHRLDMSFTGELFQAPNAIPFMVREPVRHFYLPQCGANGVANVHAFERILYPEVYPGIDFWVYGGSSGQKMMIVIRPGADPNNVLLLFEGQTELTLDVFGNLKILLANQWIRLPQAVAYQYDQNNVITNVPWTAEYTPNENNGVVGFTFGAYNETKPLVLLIGAPPMGGGVQQSEGLCWSTFLGGNYEDLSSAAEHDKYDNLFVAGATWSEFYTYGEGTGSNQIPNPTGVYTVAVLNKFRYDHKLEWTTYVGGSAQGTLAYCVSVDRETISSTNIYFGGVTYEHDLNVNPLIGAYNQPNNGGSGGSWIARLNQSGLIDWCTIFGAPGVAIVSMDHDPLGRLVVAGQTTVDLPIEIAPPSLAEQYPYGGSVDAFIAVFDNSEALLWATCYGMQGNDGGATVRATNNTFVLAGNSNSPNLPGAPGPSGAYHEPLVGGSDVFLAEFDMNGHLVWTTYLGGSGGEGIGSSQALDITEITNNIYITGRTTSQDLDYRHGPGWYDDTPTDNGSYIAEFSGANRDLLWLTAVDGGTGFEDYTQLNTIRVSPELGVCVAGFGSYAIPYMNFPGVYSKSEIYPNEGTSLPNEDGVYIRFGSAHELLHGTYFGGDGGMSGDLIKSLSLIRNSAYLVGQTAKANNVYTFFPLYQADFPAWWQPVHGSAGANDMFISQFCYPELVTALPPTVVVDDPVAWFDAQGGLNFRELPSGDNIILLYSMLGQVCLEKQMQCASKGWQRLQLPELPCGAYVVSSEYLSPSLIMKQP